jgi:hypothetical protein
LDDSLNRSLELLIEVQIHDARATFAKLGVDIFHCGLNTLRPMERISIKVCKISVVSVGPMNGVFIGILFASGYEFGDIFKKMPWSAELSST